MAEAPTDHRRATAERNVEAILDAVEALLQRHAQATMSAVATESGLSRVTVYAHFVTREKLLEATVARAVRRAVATLDAADPDEGAALEALDRVVVAAWHELDRNRAIAQASAEHLDAEALHAAHEPLLGRVLALVRRGRAAGDFRTDVPEGWLVSSCFALMHACGDDVRAGRLDPGDAPRVLTTTVRDVFAGTSER